jgi:hypothetical protein
VENDPNIKPQDGFINVNKAIKNKNRNDPYLAKAVEKNSVVSSMAQVLPAWYVPWNDP